VATSFSALVDEMDATLLEQLGDGSGDYLSGQGELLVSSIAMELNRNVERPDFASGALDRVATLTVQKSRLQPFDRQGSFVLDGKTWNIDGIESDDGQLITFYVVP